GTKRFRHATDMARSSQDTEVGHVQRWNVASAGKGEGIRSMVKLKVGCDEKYEKRALVMDRPIRTRPMLRQLDAHRSISPMTMSMLPTIAGTSAIRQPRQSVSQTLKLQKLDDLARTRNGTF